MPWLPDPWGVAHWRWWDGQAWGWQTMGDTAPQAWGAGAPPGASAMPASAVTTPTASAMPASAVTTPTASAMPAPVVTTPTASAMPASAASSATAGGLATAPHTPVRTGPLSAGRRAPTELDPTVRRRQGWELLIVLGLFPLPFVFNAIASAAQSLIEPHLVQDRFPDVISGRIGASLPFDVILPLFQIAVPLLVIYLLHMSGEGTTSIGLDRGSWKGDAALLLPVFAITYLAPFGILGTLMNVLDIHGFTLATTATPDAYAIAAATAAISAGVVEEIVVLGYLVRRLEQRGWAVHWVVIVAVLVRLSYHLYYGLAIIPFIGWATLSVLIYRRFRRLWPFIVIHVLWDTTIGFSAFFGGGVLIGAAVLLVPATTLCTCIWWDLVPRRV